MPTLSSIELAPPILDQDHDCCRSHQVDKTDLLAVILIKPRGSPTVILINWPSKPSGHHPEKGCARTWTPPASRRDTRLV